MSANVFINYRRDDVAGMAGRLYDRLTREFPKRSIFMDVDAMRPGLDFSKQLDEQVASCAIVLALIGPGWLTARDEKGQRRLDDPLDWVRLELVSALRRDIPVVPVLLKGASLPRELDLPDELKPLVRRHAIELRHTRFGADAGLVIAAIRETAPQLASYNWSFLSNRNLALVAVAVLVIGGVIPFLGKGVSLHGQQSSSVPLNWQADPSFNCTKYAEIPESSPARSPQGDMPRCQALRR
jgi:TIR domain